VRPSVPLAPQSSIVALVTWSLWHGIYGQSTIPQGQHRVAYTHTHTMYSIVILDDHKHVLDRLICNKYLQEGLFVFAGLGASLWGHHPTCSRGTAHHKTFIWKLKTLDRVCEKLVTAKARYAHAKLWTLQAHFPSCIIIVCVLCKHNTQTTPKNQCWYMILCPKC